jgi:class 3 adenylate cyclase
VLCVISFVSGLTFLPGSLMIVALEGSGRYVEAIVCTVGVLPGWAFLLVLPGSKRIRLVEEWAAGSEIDQVTALRATYDYARGAVKRAVWTDVVGGALLWVGLGAIGGATGWLLVQWGMVGIGAGAAVSMIGVHSFMEGALRPPRAAIAGDTGIGDSMPRSHPPLAAWTSVSVFASMFLFAILAAMLAAVFAGARTDPVVFVVIACVLTLTMGPVVAGMTSPFLRPIRDLAEGTVRVAAGDYSRRLPVVQDDDLGALAASFNRMQAGLAERQRLQAAFGTYVDPTLAARLLEQSDDVFTGERREVTVMFVDVRDFTPFAESNSAEDTVARLNTLFEIVVPAVVDAGGHVNKFLGDGALVVFGAPNALAGHADSALQTAVVIQRLVAARFDGELRIGVGINTGGVIAGTIGGAGHLEFTLIGDTVNVAARVEQLTKTTGDAILLTRQTVDALAVRPPGLIDRGLHVLKGKSADAEIFGLDPTMNTPDNAVTATRMK